MLAGHSPKRTLFCVVFWEQHWAAMLHLLIFAVLMKSMSDKKLAPVRVSEYSASFLTFQAVWRGYLARHGGKGKGKGKGAKKPSKKKK